MQISPLQMWLALAGAVLVLAVALHGVWVSRRHAPRQASTEADGLTPAAAEGIEPADYCPPICWQRPMSVSTGSRVSVSTGEGELR